MKKRLLLLPLFAGMVLSGCDFSVEQLKFWEKKEEDKTEVNSGNTSNTNQSSNTSNTNTQQQTNNTTEQTNTTNGNGENTNPGGNTSGGDNTGGNTSSGGDNTGGNTGGQTVTGSVIEFKLSSSNESSITKEGVTVTFNKGEGQNAPKWYPDTEPKGLRIYAKNTITVAGSGLTQITFNWEKNPKKDFADVKASAGNYTHPSTTGQGVWKGSASSVVFTLGDAGQLCLNTFSVVVGGSSSTTGGDPTGGDPTGGDPTGGDTESYSIDKVKADIEASLGEIGDDLKFEWDDYYEVWSIDVSFGEATSATEAQLKEYAEVLAACLPDYLEAAGYKFTEEDADYYASAAYGFMTPSEDIVVEVGAVFYSDYETPYIGGFIQTYEYTE